MSRGILMQKKGVGYRAETSKIYIMSVMLKKFDDVYIIEEELKRGNIVIVNISRFLTPSKLSELKQILTVLKRIAGRLGGDIARLGNQRIILTPSFVEIVKGEERKQSY